MSSKMMQVTPARCTACRNCELACAFAHARNGGPALSRIHAVADEGKREGFNSLIVCFQCSEAACVAACPAKALWRDPGNGEIYHVPERCIRCQSCVTACPFGNMRWDTLTDHPSKCDLCRGDPICVRFCPTKAIEWL